MGELSLPLVTNLFLYLSIPFLLGFIASRFLKTSPVIGFLVGGIAVGNVLPDVVHQQIVTDFAHFGIILLFFTVGLEVSFSRIIALKKFILRGGIAQLIVTWFALSIVSMLFGFAPSQAILLGIVLSASSTSLVAKILQEKREEGTLLGELTIGTLMLQDLAFIPFVILFSSITQQGGSFVTVAAEVLWGIGISAVVIAGMYMIGKRAVPTVFDRIARIRRDLLNFFIIVFIFLVALISALLHIPVVVGAFIAGVLVAQTHEHYHIFSQIRPLRDLLAALFFIYIGSGIQLLPLAGLVPQILLFTLALILVKSLIVICVFVLLRFNARFAFYMATHLFQVGETAFILLLIATGSNLFTQEQYLVILASVVITLILTPFVIARRESMYRGVRSFLKKMIPQLERYIAKRIDLDHNPIDVMDVTGHVVICGYGRVGSEIGKALNLAKIPFVAIDYNFALVERVKKEGVHIIYGDPTDRDLLDFAGCEKAVAIVSAVPSQADQEVIVLNAKRLNPKIFIISRVQTDEDKIRLKDLGAHAVVQPELEASISIIRRILVLHNKSKEEIVRWLRHLKLIHGSL